MVSPKKKTVTSKAVVSKAFLKLRMGSPDYDSSGKYLSPGNEMDGAKRTKKAGSDSAKRKRSGSIINSIKNPFATREQLQQLGAVSDRNTLRTGKGSSHSESKSRLHVPRVNSRENMNSTTSSLSSSRRSDLLQAPYDHDVNALEKGELHREQSPLIPDNAGDSTNYQSFVHVEQAPVITQGSMPMTPIPLPGHNTMPVQVSQVSLPERRHPSQAELPTSPFLKHLYEKYPSYITGIAVIFVFAGSMYSISTGKGTQYLTAIMKATLCWLLGSNTADLIFGDEFCEFDFQDANSTAVLN